MSSIQFKMYRLGHALVSVVFDHCGIKNYVLYIIMMLIKHPVWLRLPKGLNQLKKNWNNRKFLYLAITSAQYECRERVREIEDMVQGTWEFGSFPANAQSQVRLLLSKHLKSQH